MIEPSGISYEGSSSTFTKSTSKKKEFTTKITTTKPPQSQASAVNIDAITIYSVEGMHRGRVLRYRRVRSCSRIPQQSHPTHPETLHFPFPQSMHSHTQESLIIAKKSTNQPKQQSNVSKNSNNSSPLKPFPTPTHLSRKS